MSSLRAGVAWLASALVVGVVVSTTACTSEDPDRLDPTSTDIVLVEVSSFGGLVAFGEPRWITDRSGYDNQPAFTADGRGLLFSSQFGTQADVYRYDIDADDVDQLTLTLESEFSPQPLPAGEGFSCVRVEQDGRQRIWAFDPLTEGPPNLVLPSPDYVGYYTWLSDGSIVTHTLGAVPTLQWTRPPAAPRTIAEGIGRSIQAVPGQLAISYSLDDGDGRPWIRIHDLPAGPSRPVAPALEGSEDHAWLPDGTLLMGRDGIVYVAEPGGADDPWTPWIDLTDAGVEGITRIAVSPQGDRLALVVQH